jgi:hypothetical protein
MNGLHVKSQIMPSFIRFITFSTGKWPFSSMCAHVPVQVRANVKLLVTLRTFVKLRQRVRKTVKHEPLGREKRLATRLALEHAIRRMHHMMILQFTFGAQVFAARVALKRLFAGMNTFVVDQPWPRLTQLATSPARQRFSF